MHFLNNVKSDDSFLTLSDSFLRLMFILYTIILKSFICFMCKTLACVTAFSRSNKLSRHMRVHTGQRPYKCTYCEKAFSQSNDLTLHVRRHTGDRPYICHICGDRFIQVSFFYVLGGYSITTDRILSHIYIHFSRVTSCYVLEALVRVTASTIFRKGKMSCQYCPVDVVFQFK